MLCWLLFVPYTCSAFRASRIFVRSVLLTVVCIIRSAEYPTLVETMLDFAQDDCRKPVGHEE